jgi:hypothetical protein
VTTVFSAYVTGHGQAWADFDVYMPQRWARDDSRRQGAGIPADLEFATKPQLAMGQLKRLATAGLPIRWVAFDEVYGRSEQLRKTAAGQGLAYAAIIPCDYQVTLPSGTAIRADEALAEALFERRSCGNGSKGPRYSDWAMLATAIDGQYLLIRRLLSRPDQVTFYLCWAPPGRPATMTFFITIAGRRWPVEETFKTGKDVLGWDQGPGTHLERDLPAHHPVRPRPATRRRDPRRAHRYPHPARHQRRRAGHRPRHGRRPARRRRRPGHPRRRRPRPSSPRPALPCRPPPDQTVNRRDHPPRQPRRPLHSRIDHRRCGRVRAALVTATTMPSGRRPMAPLQHPAHGRHRTRNQLALHVQKGGNTM